MTARMSSVPRILYSLPSSLTSVPPYLLTRTRSPTLTSKGIFLPLSSTLPVPSARMIPSVGFSLAVSGMMMPPFFVSFSSTGSTRTRSPRGLRFNAIVLQLVCCLFDCVLNQLPPHPPRENDDCAPRSVEPRNAQPNLLLIVDDFGVDNRLALVAARTAAARASLGFAALGAGRFFGPCFL